MTAPAPALEPALGFVVLLPEPPSDNRTRKPGKRYRKDGTPYIGMVPTKELESWKVEAGHLLNRQTTESVPDRFVIDITLTDAGGACDTSNVIKATLDLLVAHKLIRDDARRYQRACRVEVWPDNKLVTDVIPAGQMQVRVQSLPERGRG